MAPLFGGIAQLDAADEYRVQQLWLGWQARLDGQNKHVKDEMDKAGKAK